VDSNLFLTQFPKPYVDQVVSLALDYKDYRNQQLNHITAAKTSARLGPDLAKHFERLSLDSAIVCRVAKLAAKKQLRQHVGEDFVSKIRSRSSAQITPRFVDDYLVRQERSRLESTMPVLVHNDRGCLC
jgi:hypothetical protein